jgi:hypothetical protein
MPIPILNELGELPPGIHVANLDEIEREFGNSNSKRSKLMSGLKMAADNFKQAGVTKIFVDGSFATAKEEPNDIDGCWSAVGNIDLGILDPLFWNFNDPVEAQQCRDKVKDKYGLDFFIAEWTEGGSGKPFPEFFQTNRDSEPKGILQVDF